MSKKNFDVAFIVEVVSHQGTHFLSDRFGLGIFKEGVVFYDVGGGFPPHKSIITFKVTSNYRLSNDSSLITVFLPHSIFNKFDEDN